MKCFSFEIIGFSLFAVMFFTSLTPATSNVIGGALNTNPSLHGGAVPRWVRNILSTIKFYGSESLSAKPERADSINNRPADIFAVISTKEEPAAPLLVHKPWESTGIQIQTPVISGLDRINPFLRTKRQANDNSQCQLPENLPETVLELNSYLNESQFLGLNPDSSSQDSLPLTTVQPETCPDSQGDWWPRSDINLRSTCPWIYKEKNLGENVFPRYVHNAKCLCTRCINAKSMGCQELKQDVTVMRRTGCENGMAVMVKETIKVVVGCVCVSSPEQTTPPSGYNGPPLTQ